MLARDEFALGKFWRQRLAVAVTSASAAAADVETPGVMFWRDGDDFLMSIRRILQPPV